MMNGKWPGLHNLLINLGELMANKMIFRRTTQEDLLREQNRLLMEILAKREQPLIVHVPAQVPQVAAAPSVPPADFSFDEPEEAFVPKVKVKGEAALATVPTASEGFDAEKEAEKIRITKQKIN